MAIIEEIRVIIDQIKIICLGALNRNANFEDEDVDKCSRKFDKLIKELGESSYEFVATIHKNFQ